MLFPEAGEGVRKVTANRPDAGSRAFQDRSASHPKLMVTLLSGAIGIATVYASGRDLFRPDLQESGSGAAAARRLPSQQSES